MAKYLLIESRDPYDSADTAFVTELAATLHESGAEVTIFLVQNGVLPVRKDAWHPLLEGIADAGIRILADSFSLRERGIAAQDIAPGVQPAELDIVVDALADGTKTIWH